MGGRGRVVMLKQTMWYTHAHNSKLRCGTVQHSDCEPFVSEAFMHTDRRLRIQPNLFITFANLTISQFRYPQKTRS